MLPASIQKNDKRASLLIILFSVIVFVAVVFLSRVKLDVFYLVHRCVLT